MSYGLTIVTPPQQLNHRQTLYHPHLPPPSLSLTQTHTPTEVIKHGECVISAE